MSWSRPVPLIGDTTSAAERAADPAAWAFPQADRDALHAIVAARRDIRRFRPDAIPDDAVERVLTAGHRAPSVGHSQPWRFIVVTSDDTRHRAKLLADRARLAQAALLREDSARRLLDLQLDGIREAPVGIVVCCDRRSPAAGVLGRATFPDADIWSCACAIQNMWLASRSEGLGMGWVTLFDPAELAALLHLPDGVMTLGWLCLGWPDERPPQPGLERAGWSRRAPLADVVLHERWPHDEPPAPPSHLRSPGPGDVVAARDDRDALLTPPSSLGALDDAVDRVAALQHPHPDASVLVLVAADHAVTAYDVSAYPVTVTADVARAAVDGVALGVATATATATGMTSIIVDAGVGSSPVQGALDARPVDARGDLVTSDAMTRADVDRLLALGHAIGATAGATNGLVAIGEVGVGNTTVAAALTAVWTGLSAAEAVGLGAGADSAMLDRKREVVRRAVARARDRGMCDDPRDVLAAVGGPEFAVLAGVVLGAAESGAAVVLDGLATGVAALAAVTLDPTAAAHLVAGQRSREAAHAAVLQRLGLEPLLDLRLRAGEGVGAVLAVGLLTTATQARRRTARTV